MNYQETLYGKQYLLGRDVYVDGQHKILNVPLIDVMDDLGFIPKGDYSQIYTLSVVWYDNDGEIMVIKSTTTIVVRFFGKINLNQIGQIMMTNF